MKFYLTSFFAVAFLFGCSGMPTPSESDGGLYVIPLEIVNDAQGSFSFVYTFNIVDSDGNRVGQARIDPQVHKNTYVVGPLPAGTYTIDKLYSRPKKQGNSRYTFKEQAYEIGFNFVIAEDALTLADYVFYVQREKVKSGYSTHFNFYQGFQTELSEAKFEQALEEKIDLDLWHVLNLENAL